MSATDDPYLLDLMTATPSDYLYVVRDTAGRAADALREQIDAAQKVLDGLTRIANDAEDAAQLVAASDLEPGSSALVPERSGLTRRGGLATPEQEYEALSSALSAALGDVGINLANDELSTVTTVALLSLRAERLAAATEGDS